MTFHNAAAHPALAMIPRLDLPGGLPLRALRAATRDRIEALIAFLDATEPDPDLEDGHDAEAFVDDDKAVDDDPCDDL